MNCTPLLALLSPKASLISQLAHHTDILLILHYYETHFSQHIGWHLEDHRERTSWEDRWKRSLKLLGILYWLIYLRKAIWERKH